MLSAWIPVSWTLCCRWLGLAHLQTPTEDPGTISIPRYEPQTTVCPIIVDITTSNMLIHIASKHNHFILGYTAHQMKHFVQKYLFSSSFVVVNSTEMKGSATFFSDSYLLVALSKACRQWKFAATKSSSFSQEGHEVDLHYTVEWSGLWKQLLLCLFFYFNFAEFLFYLFIAFHSTHTHTRLTALFPGLPRWAGTRKAKPSWILLGHMQVCISLQTDNHASTPPL